LEGVRMRILWRSSAVVLCLLLPITGCFPLWETLRIERFTIAPDGTLSGFASGWNTIGTRAYKSVLKPGQTIQVILKPTAALCANESATNCHLEGILVRIEKSADERSVSGLVITVSALSAEKRDRKSSVRLSSPVGEQYLPVGDISAFRHTNVGACTFFTCIGD
jgi:hypothetical protein